jgi:hypothetical protein
LRADLGLLHRKVVEVCEHHGVRYSIIAKLTKVVSLAILAIAPTPGADSLLAGGRRGCGRDPLPPAWHQGPAGAADHASGAAHPADSSPCSATTTTIRSSPTGPGTLWSLRPTIPPRRDRIRHLRPRAGGRVWSTWPWAALRQRRLVGPVRDYRNNLAHWTGRPGLGKAREALPTRAAGHPGPCCNTRSQSGRWARPGENDPATRVLVTGSSATSGPA